MKSYPEVMQQNIYSALERCRKSRQHLIVARTDRRWHTVANSFVHTYPEIFLQVEGASEFVLPGGTLMLKAGQTLIVPAGVAHFEVCHPSKKGFLSLVVMMFGPLTQMHLARGVEGKQPTIEYAQEYTHDVRPVLYQLVDACIKVSEINRDFEESMCHAVWSAVELLYNQPVASEARNPKISMIMNMVRGKLDDQHLSIKTLAKALHYNPDYLSNLFRRETGETFNSWLCRQRMSMAQKYLRESPLDIAQITRQCGYNDASYFASVFRKRFDMTPRQYRRKVQGRSAEDYQASSAAP